MDRAYVSITIANTVSVAIMLGVILAVVYGVRKFVLPPKATSAVPVTTATV